MMGMGGSNPMSQLYVDFRASFNEVLIYAALAAIDERAVETLPAVKLVRKLAGARPEIAGAVDPRLRRRNEIRVGVDPLRIVRGQDVRLDAVRG